MAPNNQHQHLPPPGHTPAQTATAALGRGSRRERNLELFLALQRQHNNEVNNRLMQQQQHQQHRRLRAGVVRGSSVSFSYGQQSFLDRAVELLDPDLRPVPPQPSCPQSMQIYDDHRRLAANYLDVKDKIVGLRQYKQELQDRLEREGGEEEQRQEEEEQERIKDYLRLQEEKESLLQFQEKLSTQLQLIKKAKSKQQLQATPPQRHQGSSPSSSDQLPRSLEDAGWVLVQQQQQQHPPQPQLQQQQLQQTAAAGSAD